MRMIPWEKRAAVGSSPAGGDWTFHSRIHGRQEGAMMSIIRVVAWG